MTHQHCCLKSQKKSKKNKSDLYSQSKNICIGQTSWERHENLHSDCESQAKSPGLTHNGLSSVSASSDSDGEPLVEAMQHSEGKKRKIKFQQEPHCNAHAHNMHATASGRATVISLAKYMVSTAAISFQDELDCCIPQTPWWHHASSVSAARPPSLRSHWLFIQPWRSCEVTRTRNEMSPATTFTKSWLSLWPLWPTEADIRENSNHPPKVWAWRKLIGPQQIMQGAFWSPQCTAQRETWKSTCFVIFFSLPLIYSLLVFQQPGNACQTSHPITVSAACIAAFA